MTIMARTACVSLVDIIVDVHFKIIYTTLYFCHFFHEECALVIITLWGALGINRRKFPHFQKTYIKHKKYEQKEKHATSLFAYFERICKELSKVLFLTFWVTLFTKKTLPIPAPYTSEPGWRGRKVNVFLKHKENAWKLTNGFLLKNTHTHKWHNDLTNGFQTFPRSSKIHIIYTIPSILPLNKKLK